VDGAALRGGGGTSVNVTERGPVIGRLRWLSLPHAMGAALVVLGTGLWCLVFAAVMLSPLTDGTYFPDGSFQANSYGRDGTATDVYVWCFLIVVLVVPCPLGVFLLRRGRRGVLYLRHFGHTTGTEVLSGALRRTGGRWRFVTLDDRGTIVAQGVRSRAARAGRSLAGVTEGRAGHWALAVADHTRRLWVLAARLWVLAAAGLVYAWIRFPATDRYAPVLFPVLIGTAVILGALAGIRLAMALAGASLLPMGVLISSMLDAAGQVEERKAVSIDDESRIPAECHLIRSMIRRAFGPRLAVVTVSTAFWRRTVLTLATTTPIALFDVSQPSDSLLWEIDQLTPMPHVRCIFVGQRDELDKLNHPDPRSTGRPARAQEEALLRRLEGRTVLAYGTDRKDLRAFVKALRATLATPSPPIRISQPETRERGAGSGCDQPNYLS
jgi:hypothetical protein